MSQTYTITQAQVDYTFPVFQTDTACVSLDYIYTVSDPVGEPVISFNGDPDAPVFSFLYSDDLVPAGQTYTITVTGTVNGISEDVTFDLVVENPCTDTAYFQITDPSPLISIPDYVINSGKEGTVHT